jgi:hypothetical protein
VAFTVAFVVCWRWNFDAISMIVLNANTTRVGEAITGGIIAGGAKGSVKLFRDVLGFKSTDYENYDRKRRALLELPQAERPRTVVDTPQPPVGVTRG